MENIVVTGAARGMGLEFARQYLARGARVFAGVRNVATCDKLRALGEGRADRLVVVPMDVADEESIRQSATIVAQQTDAVDVLINNAGIGGNSRDTGKTEELGTFHFDDAWVVLRTMAVGPLLMVQEYLPMLKRSTGGAKVANVSSGYGSISGNTNRSPYYYSAAKSALHQLMRSFAADGRQWNIATVLLDPGWVQTDMGGPNAPLPVDQSIGGMIQVIDNLTVETTGRFVKWDGSPMAW